MLGKLGVTAVEQFLGGGCWAAPSLTPVHAPLHPSLGPQLGSAVDSSGWDLRAGALDLGASSGIGGQDPRWQQSTQAWAGGFGPDTGPNWAQSQRVLQHPLPPPPLPPAPMVYSAWSLFQTVGWNSYNPTTHSMRWFLDFGSIKVPFYPKEISSVVHRGDRCRHCSSWPNTQHKWPRRL